MKSLAFSIALLVAIAFCLCARYTQSARTDQSAAANGAPSPQSASATFPKDIFPETGNRLPGIKRDSLDDAEKNCSTRAARWTCLVRAPFVYTARRWPNTWAA